MERSMTFELLPAFLMAVLACWLGLSLLVRVPRDRTAQVFAWLCLNLTLYGLTIVLGRLTAAPDVVPMLNRLQLAATALLPPVFLHFMMRVAAVPRLLTIQRGVLWVSYFVGSALALYAMVGVAPQLSELPPRFPGGLLAIIWTANRAL
ncbi:MAG TPA: hypothetical protein VFX76_20615, partial [Roseiflexaceae bacterium]|nr:hypothetical protein [Roseiflexaceae bacterium]